MNNTAPALHNYVSAPPQNYHVASGQSAAAQMAAIAPGSQARLTSSSGLRGVLNRAGLNMGMSKREQEHAALIERIRTQLSGNFRIAMLNFKGGTGKSPDTVALGATLAKYRPDRVIAVDANPDSPTLADRALPQPVNVSFRDVVEHAAQIGTYGQMRATTGVTPQNLEILPGGFDLNEDGMSAAEYLVVDEVLEKFYNCLLFDMGTNLRSELSTAILDRCDAIVLVTNTRRRSVDLAAQTIDYLRMHGHEQLLEKMVVAINIETRKPKIDPNVIREGFARQSRPVHIIPFDEHVAEDGPIDLRLLAPKTARAFEELAASVATEFAAAQVNWGGRG